MERMTCGNAVYGDKDEKISPLMRKITWANLRSRGMTAEDADKAMTGITTYGDFYELMDMLETQEKEKDNTRHERAYKDAFTEAHDDLEQKGIDYFNSRFNN